MAIALTGLKVKVRDQGQTSKVNVKGLKEVGETSILSRGQFYSVNVY